MQLILSDLDLETMPSALRESLFRYLGRAEPGQGRGGEATTPLGREQVTALLREASFHRDGKALHALLKGLAHGAEHHAFTHKQLVEALPSAARANLARYLAALNRLTARVAKQRAAKLWHHERGSDTYTVHPATRQVLRDLLPVLRRSGKGEEPLWEG